MTDATREALKQIAVSTVATTIYCKGIGEVPSIVLDDESIDHILAALQQPEAGETVAWLCEWPGGKRLVELTWADAKIANTQGARITPLAPPASADMREALEIANDVRRVAEGRASGYPTKDPEGLRWLHHSYGADEVAYKIREAVESLANARGTTSEGRDLSSLPSGESDLPVTAGCRPSEPSPPADAPYVPCPVCGGEAIHAIEMLKRTVIKPDPGCPSDPPADRREIVVRELGFIKPDTDKQVFFYEQDFYVLSNFSAFEVEWSGFTFKTSEHLYHWLRFTLSNVPGAQHIAGEVKNAKSAHDAFKLAQEHKRVQVPDWDNKKIAFMREVLRQKAAQHEYVRRKLLATGDRELIEDSWRDDFWGWGPNRDGQNMLGKLWMEVRAELRIAALDGGR